MYTRQRVQSRTHLQAATFPPDLQDKQYGSAVWLPNQQSSFSRRVNLLHKSKVIWIFSLPSQSPSRLSSSILVLIHKPTSVLANAT